MAMSVKLRRWHSAVLALAVIAILTVLFALATVTSHADDAVIVDDGQGNWSYTMKGSTYYLPINLEEGKTTTIHVEGKNTLTYADHCIEGRGNLIITGDGILEVPNSPIRCVDFTVEEGAKLILGSDQGSSSKDYSLNASGSVTVNDADIELKRGYMICGSGESKKHSFNNAKIKVTIYGNPYAAYPNYAMSLDKDAVFTNCNLTLTNGGLECDAENAEFTINGGTYNISQVESKNHSFPAMMLSKATIKNAKVITNASCYIKNQEMTDTDLEITVSPVPSGSNELKPPAVFGYNLVFSGCKIKISGDALGGIAAYEKLTFKDSTDMNIKSLHFGILGTDLQIVHSGGKIQVTDPKAFAAVSGNTVALGMTPVVTPGKITLKAVNVKEPDGYTIGKVTTSVKPGTITYENKATITAILKGKVPAKTVVLQSAHTWDAGKVTKQPTATADGVKTYTCTICGATRTEAFSDSATGEDGTPFGKGASVKAAEAALAALPNDNDPAGTVFGLLQLKASKTTKSNIKLTWKKVPGATQYILFANKCGKANKFKKVGTFTGNTYTAAQVAGAKVKKGTYYKFIVIAADSNGRVVSTSKTIHVATKGGKVGNHKKVTVKKSVIKKAKKLKKGKTIKLKAKAKPQSKKLKVKKHRAVNYETSNPKVAKVNGKGVVKGVGKGTCFVYAYAQHGAFTKVKVTVK